MSFSKYLEEIVCKRLSISGKVTTFGSTLRVRRLLYGDRSNRDIALTADRMVLAMDNSNQLGLPPSRRVVRAIDTVVRVTEQLLTAGLRVSTNVLSNMRASNDSK